MKRTNKRECKWCSREIIQTEDHKFVGTRIVRGKRTGIFMHEKCYAEHQAAKEEIDNSPSDLAYQAGQ